jgi:phage FluMu protein Com
MMIESRCIDCNVVINRIPIRSVSGDEKITDHDVDEMVREVAEQKAAGFLKLFCPSCQADREIDTRRVK